MANTYTQIYIQVVFSVQGRQSLIRNDRKEELYKYISGIVRNKKQKLIAINGTADHVHMFLGIKPDISLSDLVRDIKNNSSRFISDKKWIRGKFSWQEGFGAFSYGHSQLDAVVKYIENQERHHSKRAFKDEYMEMLKKFSVAYDERYAFQWVD